MIRALPLLLLAAPAAAATHQDTAALDRSVAAFTGRPIGAEGGARSVIDTRMRLAACPTVALSWRTEAQDAVVVACSGPSWRIFVPVIRAAPVTAAPTQTAARPAPPPKAEPVIRRGDAVVIEAGSPGFSISREGVAMADAAPGARLTVRVEGKTAPVQAVALEPGRATLPGWTR
jgi:flagella basal body P-ring formation protein FlgA